MTQAYRQGISVLQKLSKGIKEYNSDYYLDYATVQETLGTIYLMTAVALLSLLVESIFILIIINAPCY